MAAKHNAPISVDTQEVSAAVALKEAAPAGINLAGKNMAYQERLDHLRFLAAFLIIFHHSVPAIMCAATQMECTWPSCYSLSESASGLVLGLRAFIFEGHTAVALFMTLSGFLFARICNGKELSYPKFFLNRVLRIYPLYLGVIFLAMYLSPGNNGLISLLSSVLCLQNLPCAVAHPLLTPHLWTIAVEFQFYLLFPLLLMFYRKQGVRPLLLLIGVELLVRALVYATSHSVRDLAYQTLFGRLDQFIIGSLLGFYFPRLQERLRNPMWFSLAVTSVIVGLVTFHLRGGYAHTLNRWTWIVWPDIEALLWGGVIVAYCAASFKIPQRLSAVLAFLGTLSFSLYVCHYYLAHQMAKWCSPLLIAAAGDQASLLHPYAQWLMQDPFMGSVVFTLFTVVPAAVALSTFTFFAIEKPFMDMRVKYTS